jgi:hypothetical protein
MGIRVNFAVGVALIALITYQLGIFDSPEFVEGSTKEMYALMATSTNKYIGKHVMRLLSGTNDAILKAKGVESSILANAAANYGSPAGADSLSVGLYFEDPNSVEHPRWAVGSIVDVANLEALEELKKLVQEASTLEEPIKAVQIGPGPILKARIPWRNMLTPYIAPMLHWKRAFDAYAAGGYSSFNGREGEIGAIACEIYVTGANDSYEAIDYIVLMGTTQKIWDATFPLEQQQQEQQEEKLTVEEPGIPKEAITEQEKEEEQHEVKPIVKEKVISKEEVSTQENDKQDEEKITTTTTTQEE